MSRKNVDKLLGQFRVTFAANLLFSLRLADSNPINKKDVKVEPESCKTRLNISNEEFHTKYLEYYRTSLTKLQCNNPESFISDVYYANASATKVSGIIDGSWKNKVYNVLFKIDSSTLPRCNDIGPLIKSVVRIYEPSSTNTSLTIQGQLLKNGNVETWLNETVVFHCNVMWTDYDVTDLLRKLQSTLTHHRAKFVLKLTLTRDEENNEDYDGKLPVLHTFFKGMAAKNNCQKSNTIQNEQPGYKSMLVDFKDVPDEYNVILEPKSFDAGVCQGSCYENDKSICHAALQYDMYVQNKTQTQPYWATKKLEPLKTLEYNTADDYNNINSINGLMVNCKENMKVVECACM